VRSNAAHARCGRTKFALRHVDAATDAARIRRHAWRSSERVISSFGGRAVDRPVGARCPQRQNVDSVAPPRREKRALAQGFTLSSR
jgi:hypothetical protein